MATGLTLSFCRMVVIYPEKPRGARHRSDRLKVIWRTKYQKRRERMTEADLERIREERRMKRMAPPPSKDEAASSAILTIFNAKIPDWVGPCPNEPM